MPYERFLRFGPENLTDAELLAIILRTGTRDNDALGLANQVLSLTKYPRQGLLGLHDLSLKELMQVKGIGEVKAVKLKSITELSLRINSACAQRGLNFNNTKSVADYLMEKLRHRKTECVYLLCFDSKGQILSEEKLSDGCVNMSLISPREIFIKALNVSAVNIILAHNHPSGDPTPSKTDINITENISEISKLMDIPLLDHIIIGDNIYSSFRELNLI